MKILYTTIALALTLFLFGGCDEDDGKVDTACPGLSERTFVVSGADALLANIDQWYTYTVRLNEPECTVDSVLCRITRPGGGEDYFRLYDDGRQSMLTEPDFADSTSGDIVPNNGTYTRRINGQLLAGGETGSYEFSFSLMLDGETGSAELRSVAIEDIQPCVIASYPDVSDFGECFDPIAMEVTVNRTDQDVVDSVWVSLLDGGTVLQTQSFQSTTSDTLWTLNFAPSFFRCTPTGNGYTLRYEAATRFGMTCSQAVEPVAFINGLPSLNNSTLPDTILRPVLPTDTDTVVVTVDLDDCELLGELYYYGVKFDVRDENTPNWTQSDDFFLRDDGVPADEVAGDGTYSVGLRFWSVETDSNVLFYFRFYAVECAEPYDTSEYLMDSVRVIQQEPLLLSPPPDRDDGFGFNVIQSEKIERFNK